MSVQDTLDARQQTHGSFKLHSKVTQAIKYAMYHTGIISLSEVHTEALDMIAHKIGRIIAGDPNHADHWHDIAGYALLAEKACVKKETV